MTIPELKNILLVEDELDIQTIVQISLENIGGFNVKICNSGVEALETLKGYKPDLILMDVMMPQMDGPTTFLTLSKLPEYSTIPVIFMTAKAQALEVERYKALGVMDIITKPFDPLTLSQLITTIWEKAYV